MTIRKFRASNFGCIKNVEVSLTPLHAFIGPNNSGKSTLLRVIRTLMWAGSGRFEMQGTRWLPLDFRAGTPPGRITSLTAYFDEGVTYSVGYPKLGDLKETLAIYGEEVGSRFREPEHRRKVGWATTIPGDQLGGVKRMRLRSGELREGHFMDHPALVPWPEFWESQWGEVTGRGTLRVCRGFTGEHREAVQEEATRIFGIGELSGSSGGKWSEGVLRYLAFRVLPHLHPVSLLIVEEPEVGIYPGVIPEIMSVLRELSKKTQVLIKTYSPLVVNELNPNEVSVVTRSEKEGTKVAPIKESPNFAERSKVYRLGELWVSHLQEFEMNKCP